MDSLKKNWYGLWEAGHRQFKTDRFNQLWMSDFTYFSTWQGCQYVVFVINVYAHRIVG